MKNLVIGTIVMALLVSIASIGFAAAPAGQIIIAGSTSVQPLSDELAAAFMAKNPGTRVLVQGGGSGAGIAGALAGACQIGSSSRELTPTETGLHEYVIARDGISVIVHPSNPVTNLTSEQIRKIFAGEITNWKEVGGRDAKIMVITREAGSGTRGAFEELVMGTAKISNNAIVQGSTGAIFSAVGQSRDAISYDSMGFVSGEKSVKALKVNGVVANEANVLNKTYKIVRPFLYLTKTEPTGLVKAYIDFVLSKEGQKIAAENYIPVSR